MSFPIALQLYSVRNEAAADFRGTLEQVKAMGYDGVEFAGLHGYTAKEVKTMCDEIGLVPISAHVPYVDMLADPEGVLGTYAEIGCRFVVVPYLTPEHRPGTDGFAEVIENVKRIVAYSLDRVLERLDQRAAEDLPRGGRTAGGNRS